MKKVWLFPLMVSIGLAMAGCTSMEGPMQKRALACVSSTEIDIDRITSTAATFSQDPACISEGAGVAFWTLPRHGYAFSRDAVVLKDGSSSGLKYQGVAGDGRYLAVFDSTGNSKWTYSIKFQSTGVKPMYWLCDPTIVNSANDIGPLAEKTVPCQSRDTTW